MSKCGQKCEIYSRVTGYYRPIKNWNLGKREEFKERKLYVPNKERQVEGNTTGGMPLGS